MGHQADLQMLGTAKRANSRTYVALGSEEAEGENEVVNGEHFMGTSLYG